MTGDWTKMEILKNTSIITVTVGYQLTSSGNDQASLVRRWTMNIEKNVKMITSIKQKKYIVYCLLSVDTLSTELLFSDFQGILLTI